jgi:hypothetical protein
MGVLAAKIALFGNMLRAERCSIRNNTAIEGDKCPCSGFVVVSGGQG